MRSNRNMFSTCIVLLVLLVPVISKAQLITDTIYFNGAWRICEKPIARYYRLGTLSIDSIWFYKGKFKDYNVEDNKLICEGEYNDKGQRDGLFRFYYPNGKLMLSGKFWQGLMLGDWEWWYSNDSLKAIINFDGPSDDFVLTNFKLPVG